LGASSTTLRPTHHLVFKVDNHFLLLGSKREKWYGTICKLYGFVNKAAPAAASLSRQAHLPDVQLPKGKLEGLIHGSSQSRYALLHASLSLHVGIVILDASTCQLLYAVS